MLTETQVTSSVSTCTTSAVSPTANPPTLSSSTSVSVSPSRKDSSSLSNLGASVLPPSSFGERADESGCRCYFNEHLFAPFKDSGLVDHEVLAKYWYVGGVRIEDK